MCVCVCVPSPDDADGGFDWPPNLCMHFLHFEELAFLLPANRQSPIKSACAATRHGRINVRLFTHSFKSNNLLRQHLFSAVLRRCHTVSYCHALDTCERQSVRSAYKLLQNEMCLLFARSLGTLNMAWSLRCQPVHPHHQASLPQPPISDSAASHRAIGLDRCVSSAPKNFMNQWRNMLDEVVRCICLLTKGKSLCNEMSYINTSTQHRITIQ